MAKQKYIFLFIIVLFSFSITQMNEGRATEPTHLSLNSESSLSYGQYIAFKLTTRENIEIRWSFSGSNINVGIIVYAMTYAEYSKFHNSQPFNPYYLSDGSHIQDSGTFTITSSDDWYIIFLNADSDHQTTSLTYNVDFILATSPLFILIGILIACVAVGGIVGVIIGVYIIVHNKKRREKLRMQDASQKIVPNITQDQKQSIKNYNQKIKFCIHCGTPRQIDNAYCENCGNQF